MGRVPNGVDDVVLQPEGNTQVLEENLGILVSNDKRKGRTLGSTDDDASRASKDVVNGSSGLVQVSDGREQANQQLQGLAIRWDRFLPVRSLKVLLVENDYSTRHVVSALLRNCSYEVTAVANGLHAWRILEDLSNHIDLILTEVAMPIISGIGLLSKIMNHKTFKNIPVIMMSNHDSMGIVFKCLSKGSVDFLVKPIRKNELKNLWQHVWRRCHSSSGSGSESGTQSRRSSRSKSINDSKNNSSSSDERENGSMGLSLRDGSDEGSGAQSSWTKKECEIVSPHATRDQLEEAPDSTCAQVIITKSETIGKKGHATEVRECEQSDAQLDSVAMGKDLELGLSRSVQAALHHQLEKSAQEPNNNAEYSLVHHKPLEHQQLVVTENVRDDMRNHGSHIVSVKLSSTNQQVQGRNSDKLINEQARVDLEGCRSLELGLEKLREGRDIRADTHEDHNVLRHSDLSAFSKYTSVAPHNQPMISKKQVLIGKVGSCSPLDSSSVAITTETMHYYLSQSSSTPPNQQSNESTNKNDMVSTMRNDVPKVENLNDKSESTSVFKSFHTSSQAVQNECSLLQSKAGNVADATSNEVQAQPRNSHQVHVEHHHHHYHHYHHHVQSHQASKVHNESTLKNAKATVPQCGSSNVISGQIEGSAVNFSLNGSVSGSNQGSNGKIGSQNALNAGPTNMGCDNATAGNSNSGGLSKTSGYGSDEDRFAKREAALTKFRQKRKERCFEKKVRYQSRKKLAEQRPRVRGQFVRQQVVEAKAGQDAQSDDLISGDNSWDSMQ